MSYSLESQVLSLEGELFAQRMSAPEIVTKLINWSEDKEGCLKRIHLLGAMLRDPNMDAVPILKELKKKKQIKAFIQGLLKLDTHPVYRFEKELIPLVIKTVLENSTLTEKQKTTLQEEQLAIKHLLKISKTAKPEKINPFDEFNWGVYEANIQTALTPRGIIKGEEIGKWVNSKLCLRHVSKPDDAQAELNNGTYGDAISISKGIISLMLSLAESGRINSKIFETLLNQECSVPLDSIKSKIAYYCDHWNSIEKQLTSEEKQLIAHELEKAITKFVYKSSFEWDNRLDPSILSSNWVQERAVAYANSTTFLLLESDREPYDQYYYYELGKLGKHFIEAEQIFTAITTNAETLVEKYREESCETITEAYTRLNLLTVHHLLDKIFLECQAKI